MGQEITASHFSKHDLEVFLARLKKETAELECWFSTKKFSDHKPVAGYEMEAWLIDQQGEPSPCNEAFLKSADNKLYTAELAQFNIELNAEPENIRSNFLSKFEKDFQQHWLNCQNVAESLGCRVLSTEIGRAHV